MSSIINVSIDLTQLDKAKLREGKWLDINLSVNDEPRLYGNVSASYSQSKEQREAKEQKEYLKGCFAKVVWTDGKIVKWEKPEGSPKIYEEPTDLPF